jgi:hypothetical protein
LKDNIKNGSAVKNPGCSLEKLKLHLEKQFYSHLDTKEMMTWDNHSPGGWHIDHIIPLSTFDLTDINQLKQACYYTNLQPLWAKENLTKGAKYE